MHRYEQSVFSGDDLFDSCQYFEADPEFYLIGANNLGETLRFPVGEQLLSRHILMLGGIGTGKSNAFSFLIRNIRNGLSDKDVAIIFDTKGDYYKEFYRPGDVVISNDERASGGSAPDYWNIFGEVSIDSRIEENILEISNGLFEERQKNSNQPFFPNAAKDLFSAVMLHLIRSEQFASCRNNEALRSIFDSFSVKAMKDIIMMYPDLKAMSSYIEDERSGQTLGIVSELQQMVRELFVGNFKKQGTLSMRNLVREKKSRVIFIEYDLGIGGMLTPIYRQLIDLAIKEALCRKENEGSVYFVIDEFRLLPNLKHIDDGVNFGRSLGAKFMVGIQNVDQVAAAYGKELSASLLSGFATTFSFRVNDMDSREYIKNLFGRNVKLQTYMSAVSSRGVSEQIRDAFVVEDSDITNLPIGCAIVGAPGCQPFRFQFKRYESSHQKD